MKKATIESSASVGIYGAICNAMQRLVVTEFMSGDDIDRIATRHPGLTVEAIEFLIRGALLKQAQVSR